MSPGACPLRRQRMDWPERLEGTDRTEKSQIAPGDALPFVEPLTPSSLGPTASLPGSGQ